MSKLQKLDVSSGWGLLFYEGPFESFRMPFYFDNLFFDVYNQVNETFVTFSLYQSCTNSKGERNNAMASKKSSKVRTS